MVKTNLFVHSLQIKELIQNW